MKILERLALVLFSVIIMVIAVTCCLIIFNLMELKSVYNFLDTLIRYKTARNIISGVSIVSILLAIKALFFPTKIKKKQEVKTGVLLENKDGRLLISKETIENLVNSVVKSFDEAIDVQTKVILDGDSNITVFISLLVRENSIIKELSTNIQNKIKDTIKRSTDLEVEQVNINVKDIDNSKVTVSQTRVAASSFSVRKAENKVTEYHGNNKKPEFQYNGNETEIHNNSGEAEHPYNIEKIEVHNNSKEAEHLYNNKKIEQHNNSQKAEYPYDNGKIEIYHNDEKAGYSHNNEGIDQNQSNKEIEMP